MINPSHGCRTSEVDPVGPPVGDIASTQGLLRGWDAVGGRPGSVSCRPDT